MDNVLEKLKKLELKVKEQNLKIQTLENEINKIRDGEYGSGIFLEGCSEADIKYITGKQDKKEGA